MQKAPILLTGATGFIGHHLASALAEGGYNVRYLVRSSKSASRLPTHHPEQLVIGDLLDIHSLDQALAGCTRVIHAAAKVSFQSSDKSEMWAVNEGGTANLVNAALANGINHFVHLSSVAALNRASGKMTSLNDNWQEQLSPSVYGQTKFAAERQIWRGQAEGLSVSLVYPSTVIGTGDWLRGGTPRLFHRAKQGMTFSPSGSAGFVAVEDVVQACLWALEKQEDGLRMLLNAESLSWKKALEQIAVSVGSKPPRIVLPTWASAALWPVSTLVAKLGSEPASISKDLHLTATAEYAYDGSSYTSLVGRQYKSIQKTIELTGKAYLSFLGNNDMKNQ